MGNKVFFCKEYEKIPVPSECFTETELHILAQHDERLCELMMGRIKPKTEAQEEFVQKYKNSIPPSTEIERVWCRYLFEIQVELAFLHDEALSSGQYSYEKVRKKMEIFSKLGSERANQWLEKEGLWEPTIGNGHEYNRAYEQGRTYYVKNIYNSVGDSLAYDLRKL